MSAGYIADRAKLKGQTREKSYYKGDPGEAATLEITGADALNPNENPSVVEETGSTSQNRKYRLGIPGGKSAYDIAVKNGFKGTEQEWLDSLHGSGGGGGDITADAIEKALGYLPADPSDIDPAGTARSLVGEHNKDIEAHNDIRLLLLNLENEIPETTSRLENDSGFITKAVADLVNYYTKSQTYTKDEINNLVSAVPKFSIQVVASLPTTNISSTTVYLLKSGDEQSNLYTEYIYVNGAWEYLGKQTVDLSGYALKTDIPTKLSALTDDIGYITQSALNTALAGYAKTSQIPTKTSQLTNDSNFLTQHQDLSGYAKTSQIPTKTSQLTNDSGFLTQHQDLSGYAKTSQIPTKTSQLENDSNFLTQHQDLSGYAKKATTLAGYGITDGATKSQVDQLNKEKADLNWGASNVGKILMVGSDGKLVLTDMPEASGDVTGVLDESMNILLSGNIADGTYTLNWLLADGTIVANAGNLSVSSITEYMINTTLSNCSASGATSIRSGGSSTVTITANSGYVLPDVITVSGASYTWNKSTGAIVLSNPTSDVQISVTALEKPEYTNFCDPSSADFKTGCRLTSNIDNTTTLTGGMVTNYIDCQQNDIIEVSGINFADSNNRSGGTDFGVATAETIQSSSTYFSDVTFDSNNLRFTVVKSVMVQVRFSGLPTGTAQDIVIKIKRNGSYL